MQISATLANEAVGNFIMFIIDFCCESTIRSANITTNITAFIAAFTYFSYLSSFLFLYAPYANIAISTTHITMLACTNVILKNGSKALSRAYFIAFRSIVFFIPIPLLSTSTGLFIGIIVPTRNRNRS